MRERTLQQWLAWQETLHPQTIDLGLARVAAVHRQLGGGKPAPVVITVAGTNGKGSSVILLETILRQAGYRTGAYLSPHLLCYNERIRVNGVAVTDAAICQAFQRIDQARGTTSLTYFEFGTLAALEIFNAQALDVVVLEVGLGGRLDATNIVDADVAVITSISQDHTQWLGSELAQIAREKAGIMRHGRPAVFCDIPMPDAIRDHASRLGAQLYVAGRDFVVNPEAASWSWRAGNHNLDHLPLPALTGAHQLKNAAGALMVLTLLTPQLPVDDAHIRAGLRGSVLPGRFQQIAGIPPLFLDVAHNAGAAGELATMLQALPYAGTRHAVAGFMHDKDIPAILDRLRGTISTWSLCELPEARGAKHDQLMAAAAQVGLSAVTCYATPPLALAAARACAPDDGVIVVFGSFVTVAEIITQLS